MKIFDTERLTVRRLTVDDAPFMLGLLNEPSFHRNIGDRGVRTVEETRAYLEGSYLAAYAEHGHSMFLVELKEGGQPIGICGLVQRDGLDDIDLGFALKPEHCSKGYAREAAAATLDWGHRVLGLRRIVAITNPDNQSSIALLEKLGFTLESHVRLPGDDKDIRLYAWSALG